MKKIVRILLFSFFYFFQLLNLSFAKNYYINLDWFKNFNDENLMKYICLALENNKDILIAKQNILKSRQERNLLISDEFPNLNIGSDYLLLKIPKGSIPNNDIQTNSYALPIDVKWELDYLGKKYDRIKQAKLDIKIAKEDLRASNLIVATDTANAYLNVSNLEKLIKLQTQRKEIYEEFLKRKTKMYETGVISSVELNETNKLFEEEKNTLENLKKERASFITELCYLIGYTPYEADNITVSSFDKIEYTGIYPEILKGDIVLNRPDIIKFDIEIQKKKLDITAAKKDFLPKLEITGNLIFSTVVNNFGWEGAVAALIAGATQNLFDGGKRIFTLKKRKIEYETALNEYFKADLNALKEVNDALYALKKDKEIYKNNKKRLEYENSNFIKIFNAYTTGARSYMDYLDRDMERISEAKILYSSKNQKYTDLISLYKASGGVLQ